MQIVKRLTSQVGMVQSLQPKGREFESTYVLFFFFFFFFTFLYFYLYSIRLTSIILSTKSRGYWNIKKV